MEVLRPVHTLATQAFEVRCRLAGCLKATVEQNKEQTRRQKVPYEDNDMQAVGGGV